MAEDMKIDGLVWNFHCQKRLNITIFQILIEQFWFLINKKPEDAMYSFIRKISVIDLVWSLPQLGLLILWEILEKYLLLSDYELIVLR